ncbi:MAG: c-type cytochrome [Phaeodactylibacter sp.]|nr:c-type cytochrome [Phaeodactylibacter sp.]
MKKAALFLVLATILWACSEGESPSTDNNQTAQAVSNAKAKKAPDGQKIYKTYCITCHGIGGDMGASGAHDLTQSILSVEERVAVITNGRNLMTPFKTLLKPEEIEAVAAYTVTLKKD